jgi:putative heme-binding domain-containing protein
VAPLNSSEIGRAKQTLATNGCTACHRIGDEGSYVGPSLNGIGSRRKADEIRVAIISPRPTVSPENRQVRLTGVDGKTITGKILNQDGYSVQMVEASGELATRSKGGAREFAIIDTNPMPSFANKITGQDLDDVVRYLSSMTEPGK